MFYQRTQTEDLKDGGVGREILGRSCHELLWNINNDLHTNVLQAAKNMNRQKPLEQMHVFAIFLLDYQKL